MNLWQFYKDNPSLLESKIGDALANIAAIVTGSSTKNALNVFVDGGGLTTTPSGTQNVSIDQTGDNNDVDVISIVLPPNAAQESGGNLAAIKADLDKFAFTATRLLVDGSGVTQPISASSLPLPANAAQETGGNLASVKADLDKFTFTATRLLVDGSGVTQPVSGTVNSNATLVPSVQSAGNSSTTALGANATFTGSFENILSYPELDINVAGSGSGATPGTLYFEFSPDGTNVDVSVPLSIADINAGVVSIPLRSVLPFFRVRYVNGSNAQTALRLTVIYHRVNATRLTRFLNQSIGDTEPVEVTGSIIKGSTPTGVYKNLRATGVSNSNNTTTPLGIGGIFTGTYESIVGWESVSLFIQSDQSSIANGVELDFSADGSTLLSSVTYTYNAPGGFFVAIPAQTNFVRAKFTNNGTTAQTTFTLQTFFRAIANPQPVSPLSNPVTDSTDTVTTHAVLTGKAPNNSYLNVPVDASGNLNINIAADSQPLNIAALKTLNSRQVNVTTTSAQVDGSPLVGRKSIAIKNISTSANVCFISGSNVTVAGSGWELAIGESIVIECDDTQPIYAATGTGTATVSILEIK